MFVGRGGFFPHLIISKRFVVNLGFPCLAKFPLGYNIQTIPKNAFLSNTMNAVLCNQG